MTNQAVATTPQRLPTPASGSVRALLQSAEIQKRFAQVLGERAPQFIASLSTMVYANPALRECDAMTVITSALQAAAFDLPIDPNLGFAHLVPYSGKARFQPGWRAYVQLAHRTGQYAKINVTEVYAGEYRGENRLTGDIVWGERTGDEIVGYAAYFRLTNGFEKSLYMTADDLDAHGKRYSKSYSRSDSAWKTNFDAMARKTVLKSLLSKWGPLSIQLQKALAADVPPDDVPVETPAGNASAEQHAAGIAALYGEEEPGSAPTDEPPPLDNAALDAEILAQDAKTLAKPATPFPGRRPGGAQAGAGETRRSR